MSTASPLTQSQLPMELFAHLIDYLERRIPPSKYSLGELKRRLLICAVRIVNHYGWKANPEFKESVKELVILLADIYSHLTRDCSVLPSLCQNQNSIEIFFTAEDQAPP